MKRLWIADIHANLPAFEATIDDAGDVNEIVFLGDIIGFGPHPAECLNLLKQLQPRAVTGNHDTAILALRGQPAKSLPAQDWDIWTSNQLSDAQRAYLAGFPSALQVLSNETEIKAIHQRKENHEAE